MSEHKISGACSTCDAMCFEVLARNDEHERRPGEPKRLGAANDDAIGVSFLLYDGSNCRLTFCGACATALNLEQYTELWRKCLRSWIREIGDNGEQHNHWMPAQFSNGLLVEIGRVKVKELQ